MKIKSIHTINEVRTLFYPAFEKGVKINLIIFHAKNNFKIISSYDYRLLYELEGDLGSYHFFCEKLFLSKKNEILEVDIKNKNTVSFSKTLKNKISIHNFKYSSGITTQRKPRLKEGEIINNIKSEVIHKWIDEKNVLCIRGDLILFYSRNNVLELFNIEKKQELWRLKLDDGSFGQRIIGQTEEFFYLQRALSKKKRFNILKLEKSTGKIIWETENTHPYYCFSEEENKLYGLGGKRFEVINTLTGEKELVTEIDADVLVASHLIYYSDGFLYFSSHLANKTPVIGAVNVKTGKIDFIQEVNVSAKKSMRIGIEKPIVVNNRLYVKDTLNTLHIFERSES